jgi:cell division septum initiation protein DivIVA
MEGEQDMTSAADPQAGSGARRWRRTPLSAEEVEHYSFGDARLGRRGYDRQDVAAFCRRVAAEIRAAVDENASLRADNERLKNYFRSQGIDVDAERARRVSTEAITLMSRAQAQAERTLAEARDQALSQVHDARAEAAAIVARARAEADRAAQAYRRSAGAAYNATTEECRRLAALLNTIQQSLAATRSQLPAVQAQLNAAEQVLAWEIRRLSTEEEDGVPASMPISPGVGPIVGQAGIPIIESPTGEPNSDEWRW